MFTGLASGILWALDTVIIGIALSKVPFIDNSAILIAPIVSTFIHDFFSLLWATSYMGIKRKIKDVLRSINTPSGRWIVLGAILGGPVGMSCYVIAISTIGPGFTAIISSLYPAFGVILSCIFLKDKVKWYQIIGLALSITGVILLGYDPQSQETKHLVLGFSSALICALSWASEVVILSHGMKNEQISDEMALNIRQLVSSIVFALILVPLFKGYPLLIKAFSTVNVLIILASALFGTASYILYYRAIHRIGPTKAMPLNVTYGAWALLFSVFTTSCLPSLESLFFALIILCGSIIAATDFSKLKKNV